MEITVGKIEDEKNVIIKEVPKKEIVIKQAPKQESKTTNIVIKQPVARRVIVKNKPKKTKKKPRKQAKPSITHKEIAQMLDILKNNQKVIEDVVKLNSNMMHRMVDLSASVSTLTQNMNKFLSKKDFEEKPTDLSEELDGKLTTLEKRLSTLMNAFSDQQKQ